MPFCDKGTLLFDTWSFYQILGWVGVLFTDTSISGCYTESKIIWGYTRRCALCLEWCQWRFTSEYIKIYRYFGSVVSCFKTNTAILASFHSVHSDNLKFTSNIWDTHFHVFISISHQYFVLYMFYCSGKISITFETIWNSNRKV